MGRTPFLAPTNRKEAPSGSTANRVTVASNKTGRIQVMKMAHVTEGLYWLPAESSSVLTMEAVRTGAAVPAAADMAVGFGKKVTTTTLCDSSRNEINRPSVCLLSFSLELMRVAVSRAQACRCEERSFGNINATSFHHLRLRTAQVKHLQESSCDGQAAATPKEPFFQSTARVFVALRSICQSGNKYC
jgi:hypothetical protein